MPRDPKRNPYLLLGIPFGAGREEANAAFVHAARRARRAGADLTELTWALNQIDSAEGDPVLNLALYRVPALPDAFATEGPGALRPEAERLPARLGDGAEMLRGVRERAAFECLRHLVVVRGQQIPAPAP